MRLSELQTKDIISTKDGKKIGKIIDVDISDDGKINFLIVEPKKFIRTVIGTGKDSSIAFTQINKIGEDVILVDI